MSMPKLGSTPWQAALKSEGGGEGSSLKLDVEAGEAPWHYDVSGGCGYVEAGEYSLAHTDLQ